MMYHKGALAEVIRASFVVCKSFDEDNIIEQVSIKLRQAPSSL